MTGLTQRWRLCPLGRRVTTISTCLNWNNAYCVLAIVSRVLGAQRVSSNIPDKMSVSPAEFLCSDEVPGYQITTGRLVKLPTVNRVMSWLFKGSNQVGGYKFTRERPELLQILIPPPPGSMPLAQVIDYPLAARALPLTIILFPYSNRHVGLLASEL